MLNGFYTPDIMVGVLCFNTSKTLPTPDLTEPIIKREGQRSNLTDTDTPIDETEGIKLGDSKAVPESH